MPLSNIGDTFISIALFLRLTTTLFDLLGALPVQDLFALTLLLRTLPRPPEVPIEFAGDGDFEAQGLLVIWPPKDLHRWW